MKLLITLLTLLLISSTNATNVDLLELEDSIQIAQENILKIKNDEHYWDIPPFVGPQYVSYFFLYEKAADRIATRTITKRNIIRKEKFKSHLIETQLSNGGWNALTDKTFENSGNLDATILNYYFLKSEKVNNNILVEAKKYILDRGGIEKSQLFTKILLAIFNQYQWTNIVKVPYVLFSDYSPIKDDQMGQWISPHLMPIAFLRDNQVSINIGTNIRELYRSYQPIHNKNKNLGNLDKWILGKIAKAQNIRGDWGGYAAATSLSILCLEYAKKKKSTIKYFANTRIAHQRIEQIMFKDGHDFVNGFIFDGRYWDTALMITALRKSNFPLRDLKETSQWLVNKQLDSGAFPYGEGFEKDPDSDQTSETVIALKYLKKYKEANRAINWMFSMQNDDGGWGAFDKNNNERAIIKWFAKDFLDSTDLFDESSADVTAHVLESLGEMGYRKNHSRVKKAIQYLFKTQRKDGTWEGRWGINAIYGTTAVVSALNKVGVSRHHPRIKKALRWIISKQNKDGGWGETSMSYQNNRLKGLGVSTPSQTAWSLLALISSKMIDEEATKKGIQYLINNLKENGKWVDESVIGTGHPGSVYIQYPSYAYAFPLMALGEYYNHLSK